MFFQSFISKNPTLVISVRVDIVENISAAKNNRNRSSLYAHNYYVDKNVEIEMFPTKMLIATSVFVLWLLQ